MWALTYAASSVVAACAGLAQVWNCLLAPYTLGEQLTHQRAAAAFTVVIGTVAAACFGPSRSEDLTRDEYLALLTTGEAVTYYVLWSCWQLFATGMALRGPVSEVVRGGFLGSVAGNFGGIYFFETIAVDLGDACVLGTEADCVALGGVGYSVWADPVFWLFVVAALVLGWVVALGLLAYALRAFEALFMVTVYETALIVSGNLCGLLVMGEVDGMSGGSLAGFLISNAVSISGLFLLHYWPSALAALTGQQPPDTALRMPYVERFEWMRTFGDESAGPTEANSLLPPELRAKEGGMERATEGAPPGEPAEDIYREVRL